MASKCFWLFLPWPGRDPSSSASALPDQCVSDLHVPSRGLSLGLSLSLADPPARLRAAAARRLPGLPLQLAGAEPESVRGELHPGAL